MNNKYNQVINHNQTIEVNKDYNQNNNSINKQCLRRLGISAAVIAAGGAAVLLSPSISSNDVRGVAINQLETLRRTIADPTVSVPSRFVHESALIGASAVNPLDILVIGGGATDLFGKDWNNDVNDPNDDSCGVCRNGGEEHALDSRIFKILSNDLTTFVHQDFFHTLPPPYDAWNDEVFQEINGPDFLEEVVSDNTTLDKYNGRLAIIHGGFFDVDESSVDIWVLISGSCWNKVLTIGPIPNIMCLLGNWKHGEIILKGQGELEDLEHEYLHIYDTGHNNLMITPFMVMNVPVTNYINSSLLTRHIFHVYMQPFFNRLCSITLPSDIPTSGGGKTIESAETMEA
ncbi:hypothetical protein ACFE04_001853 [Oxalis oulophora]